MKRFNGKPMSHWERKAKEVVVEILVRAATDYGWRPLGAESPEFPDPHQSIIHKLAADRLMAMAMAEDPEIVKEMLANRARFQENLARFVASMGGGGSRAVGGQKRK